LLYGGARLQDHTLLYRLLMQQVYNEVANDVQILAVRKGVANQSPGGRLQCSLSDL